MHINNGDSCSTLRPQAALPWKDCYACHFYFAYWDSELLTLIFRDYFCTPMPRFCFDPGGVITRHPIIFVHIKKNQKEKKNKKNQVFYFASWLTLHYLQDRGANKMDFSLFSLVTLCSIHVGHQWGANICINAIWDMATTKMVRKWRLSKRVIIWILFCMFLG